jgi:polyhydroxybutyrate depolymerase
MSRFAFCRLVCSAILTFGLLAASHPARSATEVRPFFVGGEQRSYRLFVPAGLNPVRMPVVIALHGAAQTNAEFEIDLGLNRIAEREKFVVAYPAGLNRVWDDDRPPLIRLEFAFRPGKDVAFLRGLARALIEEGIADPDRIYMAGLSMGGFMTAKMACQHAELFAAIAIVAATVPERYRQTCRPLRAMPALIMHGTLDPISSWFGMPLPGSPLMSALDAARFYAELAGCMSSADIGVPTRESREVTVAVRQWSLCRDNAWVELYQIKGGGHMPPSHQPGRGETFVSIFLGERSHAIDAAEEIWRFFRQHSMTGFEQRGINSR